MKKSKYKIPVSNLADPDMQAAPAALFRAAQRAHLIAYQAGTGVVVMRDGKVVEIEPDPEMYGDLLKNTSEHKGRGVGGMNSSALVDFEAAPFEIIDGDRGKNYPKQHEFSDSGHCLFLSAANVTRSGFEFSERQFITEQKDEALRKGKLQRDDIVLTTRGTIGNAAHFRASVPYEHMRINSGMVILRCNLERILPTYLYHFLRSPSFHAQVNSLRSGVAQPQLPIRDMKRIKIPLPSLSTQQHTASILSAYDDLIENNRRRIRLLEQAARLLYKEWFVRLRFPGHEHVKVKDGVPEGWERKTFGEVAKNFDRFRVPLSILERENRAGPYPYYGAAGILSHIDDCLFDGRFLLIGEDGTVCTRSGSAMLQFVEGKFWVSNHAHVVQGSSITTEFLYCFMSHYPIQPHITGVAQPKLSQQNLNRIEVLVPSAQLQSFFQRKVSPLIQQVFTLKSQISTLVQTRDLLLPRLMNGDLQI